MTTEIDTATLPQVTLGKTGAEVPLLGLGTAPGGFGLEDTAAIELFERAIDLGLTYVDTAPGYERAQSQLKHIVPRRRDELFLVSKTHTAEYQEALAQVAKNRRALGTDRDVPDWSPAAFARWRRTRPQRSMFFRTPG